jgi:hypothetical protein
VAVDAAIVSQHRRAFAIATYPLDLTSLTKFDSRADRSYLTAEA